MEKTLFDAARRVARKRDAITEANCFAHMWVTKMMFVRLAPDALEFVVEESRVCAQSSEWFVH